MTDAEGMNLNELMAQQKELQAYTGIGTTQQVRLARLDEVGEIIRLSKYGLHRDGKPYREGWGWWRKGEPGQYTELVNEISDLMRFLLIETITSAETYKSVALAIPRIIDGYEKAWTNTPPKLTLDKLFHNLMIKTATGKFNTGVNSSVLYDLVYLARHYGVTRVEFDKAMHETYRKVIERAEAAQ